MLTAIDHVAKEISQFPEMLLVSFYTISGILRPETEKNRKLNQRLMRS